MRSGVVVDKAPHPAVAFAVIWRGELLPMRFAKEDEALTHLSQLQARYEANRQATYRAANRPIDRPEGAEENDRDWPNSSRVDSGND